MEKQSEFRSLHKIFGGLSFVIIFFIYAFTVQPSVPFWDCGEFLSMMTWQQVPHPPGAPLFSILGGTVQVLLPFGNMGWQGNMLSVAASALTVLFLYLMTVIVIKNLRKKGIESFSDALAVYGSAFVGALGFGFSVTFWFNGMESEVYATAIFNFVIVLYLLMRWTEVADEPYNERYLLLCMYLIGLAMGVHLEGMLALFTLVLVVYFRKYEVRPKTFIVMAIIGILSYIVVIQMIGQNLPAYLAGHSPSRNEALEYNIENSIMLQAFTILCILGTCALFVWSYKTKKPKTALVSMGLLLILFTFSMFIHILVRSNANPPMNENSPKTMTELAKYIGRDQYGQTPMWPRRYQQEDLFISNFNKQNDATGEYVYGVWNPPGSKVVSRKDGAQIYAPDWSNTNNTSGDLAYMWKYQMNQMYFRYLGWNFIGRMSDVQDEGVIFGDAKVATYKTGNEDIFPINYFALPFIFGLFGFLFQFRKDPKYAFTLLCTFLVSGVLLALFQNQQEPQPRERDYFYVGSFLVFGVWMALGVYGIIDAISKKETRTAPVAIVLLISFLLIPLNMVCQNLPAYGRDGKWLPFDYAYDVLQSLEQDAILFTFGDNDTFPVWYMQDVEGVRRDVRVANLSLGNTLWYIDELKNREPWGAKKVPISFPDNMLHGDEYSDEGNLTYSYDTAYTDKIPVSKEILSQYTTDTSIINRGFVTITFKGREQGDRDGKTIYSHRVQDKLVRNIVATNQFVRPVYFLSSVGRDVKCGLDNYLRTEGLAQRICPVPQNDAYNEEVMDAVLLNIDNTDNFSKTKKYGLKLRNLNSPDVCYDETDRRTVMMTFPNPFIGYAEYLANDKQNYAKAQQVMDIYLKYIPLNKFPLSMDYESRIAEVYRVCKNTTSMQKYAQMAITSCEELISNRKLSPDVLKYEEMGRYYGPYQIAANTYKMIGQYDNAKLKYQQLIDKMSGYAAQARGNGDRDSEGRLMAKSTMLTISIKELAVDKLEQEGKIKEAYAEIQKIETELQNSNDMYLRYFATTLTNRKMELASKLGIKIAPDTLVENK